MPVGLRDRRTWRRRGPPARTLVIGTDARYWHQRALSAPTRVVDMSARYIPLAVSTTPSQCRQPPHSVDNARPRPCPENAPVRPRTAARRDYAPRVPGGFPRKAESTTGRLGCPSCPGDALFFVAVGGTKRKMPPRVWGLPVPAPRQGNARTRQGWPVLAGDEDAQAGERPHAPGLVPVRLPPGCPPPLGVRAQEP